MGYQVEKSYTVGPNGPSQTQTQLQRACWIRNLKTLEYNSPKINLIRNMGGFISPGKGGGGNPPSVWTSTMVPDDGDTSFKICHQMSPASVHLYKEEPQVVLASCNSVTVRISNYSH